MKDLDGFSFVTPSSSSTTTTTTTTSDENASRRLQLVMNGPNLAPFKCSVTYTRLPSLLQYGVIRLLSDVLEHTNSPHTSNRIVENSLILLTYGINYLNEKRYEMDTQFLQFKAKQKQLKKNKKDLKRKALEIQKAWRCHHFHTSRLPPLQLSTKSYLLLLEQDPPETKIDTLKSQEFTQRTEKYMKELQIRLAKRKEEKMEQKQLEKQKAQELREKKRALVQQRRKRYENVSRRWIYLTSRLLRKNRDVNKKDLAKRVTKRHSTLLGQIGQIGNQKRASMTLKKQESSQEAILLEEKRTQEIQQESVESSPFVLDENSSRQTSHLTASMPFRNFIQKFVARVVEKAISRVICSRMMPSESTSTNDPMQESKYEFTFNTKTTQVLVKENDFAFDMVENTLTPLSNGNTSSNAENSTSTKCVLKIGVLLCDLHFGIKYFGLIKRLFEQAAPKLHIDIEWQVFNCIRSHFPSKAAMHSFDGILVGGGPNTGTREKQDNLHEFSLRRLSKEVTLSSLGKSRIKDWRRRLIGLLQYFYKKKKFIGGLGLGHVILAEALGATIAKKTWQDGWTILDRRILSSAITDDSNNMENSTQDMDDTYGIKYLHGEYVRSMEQASKGIQVFMNYDHNSVAYFHDKYTLSFDGFPECGSFVFEAISDAYDKEDKNTAENGSDDEGNEEEEEEDVLSSKRSILGDRMLTLQEKQMVIGITDASALVARRLLQHFMLNSSSTSMSIPRDFFLTDASNHRQKHLKIMGAVGSNNQTDIIESISLITSQERVSSIFLNVRASADGHLIVLNSQLAAVVSQQDILKRERKRSSVEKISIAGKLNGVAKENGGLTLHQLREYKFYHNTEVEKPNVSTEQKLPVLASDANEGKNKHKKCPPKRVGTGVLMLSEALDIIQETQSNQKKSLYQQQPSHARAQSNRMKAKSVVIRFAEEDWVTSFRLPQRARAELRSLWLRLISALEVARYETADSSDISNKNQQHHITILSRHLQIIRFFRQKQPVWTFLKDLRLCNSLSQRVRKFPFYARYTDGILVDQEALLSCSRNEMQLILNSAQKCRLKLLVANRKDLFQDGVMDQSGTFSFVQKDFKETKSFQVNVRESFDYNLGLAEKETIIKDFMILDLLGVEGAMTWYTDLGVEAMEQIMKKTSPMFTLAEDTLKGWRCGDLQSFKKRIRRRNAIHNVNRVNDKEFDDGDELRDLSEASELSADEKDFESEVRKQIHHHCIQHVEKNSSIVLSRPAHPKTINQVIQNGNDHHNVPQSKINPSRKVNIVAPNTQAIFLDIPVKQEKEHYKSQEQKQTGAGASAPAFTIHLKPRLPHTKNDPKGQSPRKKKVDVQIECVPHKNELLNLFLTNQMSQRQINDEQSPYRVSGARTNS